MPVPATRTVLPADRVLKLAPLLTTAELVLLESDERRALRQLTTLSWVAAPPALVREVVARPDRYPEFVRNMTISEVKRLPDGSLDHRYELGYSIATIGGMSRFVFDAGASGSWLPGIDMYDPEPGGARWHRWDFLPAGGGTIIVLSGYPDVHHSGELIDRLLNAVPTLEHGLALMGQMTLLLAMKHRAEQLAAERKLDVQPPQGPATGYEFLLAHGVLSLLRGKQGRLSEMTLIVHLPAAPAAVMEVLGRPQLWSSFIPSITRSVDLGERGGAPAVELEQAVPLLSFRTVYALHRTPSAVDMLGLSGDLRGARLRWDVRPIGGGGTRLVLRTRQEFDRASVILRQLYKLEPLFEYGVNMGLGLVLLWGIAARVAP
ncbi:MAG: hypothetical protein NZ890_18840 [Myxococcota bacterium]|nr:hypothetical protein [Myxococcota bacterium]